MANRKKKNGKKIFVLDTSVIIFDPNCLYSFQENDIVIPIAVLEELDNMKKGTNDRNFSARDAIRSVESMSMSKSLKDWVPIRKNLGRLRVFTDIESDDAIKIFETGKNDHRILNTAKRMMQSAPANVPVILVTKDINLRLKAKALDINAEDYKSGMVKSTEEAHTGKGVLEVNDPGIVDALFRDGSVSAKGLQMKRVPNTYFIVKCGAKSALARYNKKNDTLDHVEKNVISNITPRNAEQTFALDAVLDPKIKLVTLQGVAGTGKTLIAMAAALHVKKNYHQIYLTRPIVPLGNKDIGFLPGDIKQKTDPYMNGFYDNIKFIKSQNKSKRNDEQVGKKIDDMFDKDKIVIEVVNYIRGRSLSNILFIVDEAQNLTPHEVKTIITRAGEGTKMVFIGDVHQIDTPYLDRHSNGLAHMAEKFRGYEFYAHVTLEKGERSELATVAGDIL
jgi:PhoH-like ATPase